MITPRDAAVMACAFIAPHNIAGQCYSDDERYMIGMLAVKLQKLAPERFIVEYGGKC